MSFFKKTVPVLVSAVLFGMILAVPGTQAAPKAPPGFIGVVPQEGVTRLDTQRMKRGKVSSLRVTLPWSSVQPESARKFDWNGMDGIMRAAAREGVRVMPTLYSTPDWLSGRSTNLPVKNKNQLTKWRKFVKAAVDRYGSTGEYWKEPRQKNLPKLPIREWQIWNEANFHYFATPVSPAKYGRLLDSSAAVIRANDRRADVVVSGLFARPKGPSRKAMYATTFLRRLVKHSKKSSIDSLAIHPYASDTGKLKQIMRDFRRTAVQVGLRSKSIQITEIGWASGRKTNAFLTGSKAAQARQLGSAFNFLVGQRKSMRLKNVYWYAWKDTDPKGINCNFCYTIGLFEHRKSKKLVAKAAWRKLVKYTRGRP